MAMANGILNGTKDFIGGAIADPIFLRWNELRAMRGTSVHICVPLNRLDTHGDKYFRLVTESLQAQVRAKKQKRRL